MNKDKYDFLCNFYADELQQTLEVFIVEWNRKNPDLAVLGLLAADICTGVFQLTHAVHVLEKFGVDARKKIGAQARAVNSDKQTQQ